MRGFPRGVCKGGLKRALVPFDCCCDPWLNRSRGRGKGTGELLLLLAQHFDSLISRSLWPALAFVLSVCEAANCNPFPVLQAPLPFSQPSPLTCHTNYAHFSASFATDIEKGRQVDFGLNSCETKRNQI